MTSADDVLAAVRHAIEVLGQVPDDDWDRPAHHLEWSCRETLGHVLDDLGGYAMQLSGERGHGERYTPLVEGIQPRPDGPPFMFWPEPEGGTAAVVQCLDAVGGLMVAVAASVPPDRLGAHPMGWSDRTGFAAMAITETYLHVDDIAQALGLQHQPDAEVCARVLDRIFPLSVFPDRPDTDDPWQDLLATTGRTDATRGVDWRWDGNVR